MSEPSCWRDPPCTNMHMYIHTYSHQQTSILLSQRGKQDTAAGVVCVCASALSVCDLCNRPCTCVYTWCVYVLCVHVLTANMFSASRLLGPGSMELQQPQPSQAARFNLVFSPNLSQTGPMKCSRAPCAADLWISHHRAHFLCYSSKALRQGLQRLPLRKF